MLTYTISSHTSAVGQARVLRPTVSVAVLEAPEVAHVPLGLVGASRLVARAKKQQ
jgi:hypothetical protein